MRSPPRSSPAPLVSAMIVTVDQPLVAVVVIVGRLRAEIVAIKASAAATKALVMAANAAATKGHAVATSVALSPATRQHPQPLRAEAMSVARVRRITLVLQSAARARTQGLRRGMRDRVSGHVTRPHAVDNS